MSDTRLYRPLPAIPVALEARCPTPLEARVEELERVERVVATLATLRNERLIEQPPRADRYDTRQDAVALTAALHPRGRRSARATKRHSSSDGTMAMRFVLFEAPIAR
jgi:hypothetical protein